MKIIKSIVLFITIVFTFVLSSSAQPAENDSGFVLHENNSSGYLQTQQIFFTVSQGGMFGEDKVGYSGFTRLGVAGGVLMPISDNISFDVSLGYSSADFKIKTSGVGYAGYGYNYTFVETYEFSAESYSIGSSIYYSFAPNEQINPFVFIGGSLGNVKTDINMKGTVWVSYLSESYSNKDSTSWSEYAFGGGTGVELRTNKISFIPLLTITKAYADGEAIGGVSITGSVMGIYQLNNEVALRLSAGFGKNTKADYTGQYSIGAGLSYVF